MPTGIMLIAEDMKTTAIQLVQKPVDERARTGSSRINYSIKGSRGGC
jgi:hypothetical protein